MKVAMVTVTVTGWHLRLVLTSRFHKKNPQIAYVDHNRDFCDYDDDDGDKCSDDDDGDDNDVDADAIYQISAALEFPADLLSIVGLEVPFHILNCISLVKKATQIYLSCIW